VREEEFGFLTLTVRVGISAASMMAFFLGAVTGKSYLQIEKAQ